MPLFKDILPAILFSLSLLSFSLHWIIPFIYYVSNIRNKINEQSPFFISSTSKVVTKFSFYFIFQVTVSSYLLTPCNHGLAVLSTPLCNFFCQDQQGPPHCYILWTILQPTLLVLSATFSQSILPPPKIFPSLHAQDSTLSWFSPIPLVSFPVSFTDYSLFP